MNLNFGALGLSVISTVMLVACKSPAPTNTQATGPVPVNVYAVQPEEASYYDVFPGTTVAVNEVQLRSEVNGYLTGIFFRDGQVVKQGQKLYEIERSSYAAAYAQAEANLQIARANQDKAQKDADRYNRLSEQDAIARQRVDYALTDLQNAKLQVSAAQAQLTSARTNLQHATITAPFTGTIGISQVKMGAFVSSGQTLLNTISSDNPMGVDFVVNEREMGRFVELQQKPAGPQDSTFTILLPDNTPYSQSGRIAFIDRAVDPQTGTIKVRLSFPNPDRSLRAGMSCNVRILNRSENKQLVAPFRAMTEQMGEYFAYVVEGDTARQRKVTLGARVGEKVIIRDGLAAGDQIVIDGIQKLREGSAVQVGAPGSAPSAPAGQASASAR